MRRFGLAGFMNLLVPGTGLVVLGRAWLGVAVVMWYALGAEVALTGFLLAPITIPRPLSIAAAVLAGIAWCVGQGLLVVRMHFLRDPNLPAELAALRSVAEQALQRREYVAARSALRVVLSIDDEDLPTRVLWARLLTETGRNSRARRAWVEVARLDARREFTPQIREAMRRLRTA